MALARGPKVALILLAVVVFVPLLLLVALVLAIQSDTAERWVERTASAAIDREVQLDGVKVEPAWPPTLHFDHLRIGNPSWAKTPNLLDARDMLAQFELWPLFDKRIVVPFLRAASATAGIEQSGARATWQFGDEKRESRPSRIELQRVYLEDGRIFYRVDPEDTALEIAVKGSAGESGKLEAEAKGKFRGEDAHGTASLPGLSTQPSGPVRLTAKATIGRTEATADGEVASDVKQFDLKVRFSGKTLKDLHKTIGVLLPDTPPYTIEGRLRHSGNEYTFDPFQGRVGDSDLRGAVVYAKTGKRPTFHANLQSKLLDFKDLGPVIGAPPKKEQRAQAAPEQKQRAAQQEASGKLLPEKKFETAKWGDMDADVRLKADRVLRPKQLPIDALATHLLLDDGVLHLTPLEFGVAGGRITTDITLDPTQQPMRGDLKAAVKGLQLGKLFPTLESQHASLGALQGRAKLVGHGASVAELLGTSDGEIDLAIKEGTVSLLLIKLLDLDVPHVMMLLGTPHKQVELRCAVAALPVKGGRASAEQFIVDTTDTLVQVEGSVNLHDETLDLVTKPRPKGKSVFVARSPIVMRGPFKHPKVHPKAGPLAARLGAAAALGAVSGPLAVIPLLETGPGKDADCDKLLGEMQAKGAVADRARTGLGKAAELNDENKNAAKKGEAKNGEAKNGAGKGDQPRAPSGREVQKGAAATKTQAIENAKDAR